MTWGQGSTRASRKARTQVLERDNHTCRLQLPGCTSHATQAHHVQSIAMLGIPRAAAINIDHMIAVCTHCHNTITTQQQQAGREHKQRYRNHRRHLPQHPHPGD